MPNIEPKLRNINKAVPPFALNKFPKDFIYSIGKELVYLMATKSTYTLEGGEWEEIFAKCINAEWRPSNVGLDDVILDNCCWGAKTLISSTQKISTQKTVRLISGRNSPIYSFGEDEILRQDPNHIGQMVLSIWNERVSGVRQIYKFVRTVVLLKGKNFDEFMVFEFDSVRYDYELYHFEWNKNKNLEGYSKASKEHCFTWQPHGSQFTIVEKVPQDRVIFKLKQPEKLNKEEVLKVLDYSDDWVTIL